MKAQHTPGPWRIWRDMDSKEPVQIAGPSHDFVCQIAGENTQAPANARLIAAAPKMLEVLGMVERAFNVEQIDAMTAFVTMEKVRGIIAKALGKDGE